MTYASINAHINVLNWFKDFGYEIIYTPNIIKYAHANGHNHIIEWFEEYKKSKNNLVETS